jgi:hypothetical protein
VSASFRVRLLLVVAAVCLAVSAATAFAASLTVSSARLTSYSAATSVPASTCSLDAAADSYVSNALLQGDTNFGGATELHVSGGSTDKRSFARFDLTSCIPSTAEIESASLRLVLATAPSASRTYAAHRVSASWAEGSITWNNQPAVGASSGTVATGTTSGVTLQWTVASDVQAFASDSSSNQGWRISDTDESGLLSSQEGRFGSSEGSGASDPELVVVFYP